ncbi:MAG: molybdopterin-dependent oxidoreductase [Gammaproteobacteria bacterium]|nr:molybdopterin-dependent oxidoreductase [Gammaproteobacteria bacterium]
MATPAQLTPTSTHWGNYLLESRNGRVAAVHHYAADRNPTPIGQSLLDAQDAGCRVPAPMVRRGWLQARWQGDGNGRGREPFVPVDWDTALDLAAEALQNAIDTGGNESIYGGSYGWASAGRFHHAQGQLKRFLNLIGGFVHARTSYSAGAAEVIVPHILGIPFHSLMVQAPTVADIARETEMVVCFGGIALKNTQVTDGGLGAHSAQDQLKRLIGSKTQFVNISPLQEDMADFVGADWWACRPNTDVAIMLGLAHTLYSDGLHDQAFLDRYCVGFERFVPYLTGRTDGQAKDADWAAGISGIPATDIRALARRMAGARTLLGISWALQRAEHGEQGYWMITLLAAMLGQIGLPGGGVAYGYGSVHNIGFAGRRQPTFHTAAMDQGVPPLNRFIPVSRISEMLEKPGSAFDYNGERLIYPDIKVILWAGGNPFHHHQDLNRLRRAWTRPEAVIVSDPFWTATARHADIVFPCTVPLERNDFAVGRADCFITPMRKAADPLGESRSDFEIFAALAERFGRAAAFTEGRDEMAWVEGLYEKTRESAARADVTLPPFDQFWAGEQFCFEDQVTEQEFLLEAFRRDPAAHPLRTPSGRIELFSQTIASFDYRNCPGHPAWCDKLEWLGGARARDYPLHLISNQPKTRLHSQLDHAATSRNAKRQGREVVRMNPIDAAARGIEDGMIVRVFNDRGACLASALLFDGIRSNVIELPTGAWFDPLDPAAEDSLEVHGNPNVLTRDAGTSKIAQGPTAHSCLVEVERFSGPLPEIKVFRQPDIEDRMAFIDDEIVRSGPG